MTDRQLLPYISNEKLYQHVKTVLDAVSEATQEAEERLYSRVVDPFGALFEALGLGMTLTEWKEKEKARQVKKTLENKVGIFHQDIIGSANGWENLGTGGVVDVVNHTDRIIAEIKNKYNTMKGNAKKGIYDDLNALINSDDYRDYTGYYVEVIPKNREGYNKLFTPSDNVTHTRRPENELIRQIDGKRFYALATGHDDALKSLYEVLPQVIGDVLGQSYADINSDPLFSEIFDQAY